MRTVYKFQPSSWLPEFDLSIQVGARLLRVDNQGGLPTLWAEVDPDAPRRPRHFVQVGTGGQVPEGMHSYIGTYFVPPFVWHVYECPQHDTYEAERVNALT